VKKRPRLSASFGAAASVWSALYGAMTTTTNSKATGLYTGTIHVGLHDDGQEKTQE
jgi:hypothetical protein